MSLRGGTRMAKTGQVPPRRFVFHKGP